MAEEVSRRISSEKRYCNPKRSTSRSVRVVHISNPTVVQATAAEFRAVVQSLTGRKRSSASSSQYEELNLYSDNQYSPQVKAPKLNEDGLQTLNDRKTSESALLNDNATVKNSCRDKNNCDVRIIEELGAHPIKIPDYKSSRYQLSEALESIGDTTRFVLDIYSPSNLFSEFEFL